MDTGESVTAWERYYNLFENMVQGVFYLDAGGTITDANPAALETIGLERDQFVGVHFSARSFLIVNEDGRELAPEQHPSVQALFTGKPVRDRVMGFFNPRKQALVWLACNAVPLFKDDNLRPYEVFITFHNITAQKEAEAALRIEQSKLNAAMRMGGMAHWEFDFSTATFILNDAFFSLYGTSIEREKSYRISAGNLVRRFLQPSFQYLLEAELARLKVNRAPDYWRDLIFGVRRLDGENRQMHSRFRLLMGDDGQPRSAVGITQDITEQKLWEETLRESEERLRLKLDSVLNPGGGLDEEELRNILDIDAVQKIMVIFNHLTGMTVAIGDTEGNLMVAVGFQDICQKFHRVHPGSRKNCLESDLFLARTLKKGEHAAYKCKNQLWDAVSPIYIGDKHVGNIFTGQYFYDDEEIDPDLFAEQALWYDFDQDEYMKALRKVPRFSREQINTLMDFLVRFAELISNLSFSNVKLTRAMVARKQSEAALKETEERYQRIAANARYMIFRMSLPEGCYEYVGGATEELTGFSPDAFMSYPMLIRQIIHPDWLDFLEVQWQNLLEGMAPPAYEFQIIHRLGQVRWIRQENLMVRDIQGSPLALEGMVYDITERKEMEMHCHAERSAIRTLGDSISELFYYRDASGAFMGCNQAFADFFGIPEGAWMEGPEPGQGQESGWPMESFQDHHVLEKRQEIRHGEWVEDYSGQTFYLETRKLPLQGENGELLGMISISRKSTGPAGNQNL